MDVGQRSVFFCDEFTKNVDKTKHGPTAERDAGRGDVLEIPPTVTQLPSVRPRA